MNKKLIQYKVFLYSNYRINWLKKKLFMWIKKIILIVPLFSKPLNKNSKNLVDILLVGASVDISRARNLIISLKNNHFTVDCVNLSTSSSFLFSITKKPKRMSSELLLEATESRYIINKFRPKIIITFTHNSIISSFLKNDIESIGGKYINIAHAILGCGYGFSMFDFHYYFVFGNSSITAAKNNKNRFGSTKMVKTGSIFFPNQHQLNCNKESNKILFFSTWLADSVKEVIIKNTKIVIKWARENPEFHLCIKLHPLEEPSFIQSLIIDHSNIEILEKSTTMEQALNKVSLVITSFSNASIEAAMAQKPIIVVNDSTMDDEYLNLENFYLPRCKNTKDINQAIQKTIENYQYYVEQGKKFVDFHLENTNDSIEFITQCIDSIYHDKENFNCIEIQENFNQHGVKVP